MTCACGCGEATTIAPRNRYDRGWVKGKPIPYVHGHNARGKFGPAAGGWKGDDVGDDAVHMRLRATRGKAADYPCVDCGGAARDWSYDETEGYSTDLSKYSPRCRPCHLKHDGGTPWDYSR